MLQKARTDGQRVHLGQNCGTRGAVPPGSAHRPASGLRAAIGLWLGSGSRRRRPFCRDRHALAVTCLARGYPCLTSAQARFNAGDPGLGGLFAPDSIGFYPNTCPARCSDAQHPPPRQKSSRPVSLRACTISSPPPFIRDIVKGIAGCDIRPRPCRPDAPRGLLPAKGRR